MNEETKQKWVATWGNAISITERKPENYSKNLTLRYPVIMQLDGSALRITLDNFCGTEAVTVTAATIAKSAEGSSIQTNTIRPLLFNGASSVIIPKGEQIVSDATAISVQRGEQITVTLYFADFTEMRSGVMITGPLSRGYFAVGEYTNAAKLPSELSKKTNCFYFLSNIDVLAAENCHCVICYGDSITAQAWPDYLIQSALDHGDEKTAFIRKAASGTRILRQYDNITYDSYGLKGNIRFPHEMHVSGADTILIQHGINDIIHPVGVEVNPFRPWSDLPTPEELIAGLQYYLKYARSIGMKTYLGTLLPIEGWRTYADFREKLRNDVNHWIRTTSEADGCVDFDQAIRSSEHPSRFAEGFDSGDHLHPSLEGYRRMAQEAEAVLLSK